VGFDAGNRCVCVQDRRNVFQLEVLHNKLKIKRQGKTKYKENYTSTMQVCE
jgi:hypothetical protein